MKNQKQGLIAAGVLFWLGTFSMFLYQEKGQMSPLLIIAAFFICLIGGVFFWGIMSLFLKFAIKYSGTNLVEPKQRTKVERVISLLSIPFAAGPIFYALSLDENYLWPILSSCVPAFLVFSPLLSKPHGQDQLLARSLVSVLGGLFVCSLVHQYFIIGVLSFPSIHTLIVSGGSSLSWCISYLLSLQANRPNPSLKLDS